MFKIGDEVLLRSHYHTSCLRKLCAADYPTGCIGIVHDIDLEKEVLCFEHSPWYSFKDIQLTNKQVLPVSKLELYLSPTALTIINQYGERFMLTSKELLEFKEYLNGVKG